MMRKTILILLLWSVAVASGSAQKLADAQAIIESGDYQRAIPMLEELAAKEPKNANVSLVLANCYHHCGQDSLATIYYQKAKSKNLHEALVGLADIATTEYRVDDAEELLAAYTKAMKRARKPESETASEVSARADRIRNMLTRVEQIEVFDSINVAKMDFFTYYRLSPESGSLNKTKILPRNFDRSNPTVVYEPESKSEMIWAAPGDDNKQCLVRSVALYGDEWDTPTPVGDHLGEGGDANYPYLMSDGITLYYANNGENSMGGYDIFITRSNGPNFLQPQNMGMPYNSPYNDYMLAIDENTGIGWWASDRNQIADTVTIYMFIPSEVRHNVDVNDPDLRARAKLTSIAKTQNEQTDYGRLRRKLDNMRQAAMALGSQCYFELPDGRVITRIDQLPNSDARAAMRQYLNLKAGIEADASELIRLRKAFAAGETSVKIDILSLENRAIGDREALKKAANEVIAAMQEP